MWDASFSDIAASFLQIRQTTTSTGQITYVADRNEATGHADAAWAIMHALINESFLKDDAQKCMVVFEN